MGFKKPAEKRITRPGTRLTWFSLALVSLLSPVAVAVILLVISQDVSISQAQNFIGPSGSAGTGQGAVGTNAAHNVSVGTSTPLGNTKLTVMASTTDSTAYALQVLQSNATPILIVRNDGTLSVATSGTSYTLNVGGSLYASGNLISGSNLTGNINAGNITAGTFAPGYFSFQSGLGIATTSQASLPVAGLNVYATSSFLVGNVGIGTTGPISALNVGGTTGITWTSGANNLGLVTIGDAATGGSFYVNTPSLNTSYHSGFAVDGTYGTPALQSVINLKALGVKSGTGYGSQLAFWTTKDATLNQVMTIDRSGNVGVGTSTPSAKLHVYGGAAVVQDTAGNFLNITTPAISGGTPFSNGIVFQTDGSAKPYAFMEGASTRMVIDGSGNVGIGTAVPSSTLHVYGGDLTISGTGAGLSVGTTTSANAGSILATGNVTTTNLTISGVASQNCLGTNSSGVVGAGTCGSLSGGQANYIPIWTSASAQGTSSIRQAAAGNSTPYVLSNGFAIGTSTSQSTGNLFITGQYLGGTIGSPQVTAGVFASGNFAFPSSLGVNTSTQASLPQALSVYGNIFASSTVLGGATSTMQVSGGPELIAARAPASNHVVMTTSIPGDTFSRYIIAISGLNEWGAGGSSDQDIALFRNSVGNLTVQSFNQGSTNTFQVNTSSTGTGAEVLGVDTINKGIRVNGASGGTAATVDVLGTAGKTAFRIMHATAADTSFSTGVNGDAYLRFAFIADGELKWGPGSTSNDIELFRNAPGGLGLQGLNNVSSTQAFNILTPSTGGGPSGGTSVFDVDTTNQRVGIGTSSPAYALDVVGTIRASGSLIGNFAGNVNAGNVSSGNFASSTGGGNFSFPANVGIATTTNASLPQALSVYGGGLFTGNVRVGVPAGQGSSTIFLGDASTSKQINYGPEAITFVEPGTSRRVFLYAGQSGDDNAKFLMDNQGFLEWGPGGTGPASDQDSSLSRNPTDGQMHLVNPYGFIIVDDFSNTKLQVNTAAASSANYVLAVNRPQGSGQGTLDIQSVTSTWPVIRAQAINSGDIALGTFVTGDSFLRYYMTASGAMVWGSPNTSGGDVEVYRPATSTLAIVGPSITSNISVGIGTASPGTMLEVDGQSYINNKSGIQLTFNETGSNWGHFYGDGANSRLYFGSSNGLKTVPSSPIMTWDLVNGNVGIGTAVPGYSLDVATGTIRVTNADYSAGLILHDNTAGSTSSPNLQFTDNQATPQSIYVRKVGTQLYVLNNSGGQSEIIGTGGSSSFFNVDGGNVYIGTTYTGYTAALNVNGQLLSAVTGANGFVMNTTGAGWGTIANTAAGSWALGYSSSVSTLGTAVLTWTNGGNVGIGTMGPGSTLDVMSVNTAQNVSRIFQNGNAGGSKDTVFVHTDQPYDLSVNTYTGAALEVTTYDDAVANNQGYILKVGRGASDGTGFLPALVVKSYSGNVGIGTTGPIEGLQLGSDTAGITFSHHAQSGWQSVMSIYRGGSVIGGITTDGTNKIGLSTGGVAWANAKLAIDSSGNVGIGTSSPATALSVIGAISQTYSKSCSVTTDANGVLGCTSDERVKDILSPFARGAESLAGIQPVIFRYKEGSGLAGTFAGFIAQNVQKYIPEAVSVQSNGLLGLDDRPILAAAVNAVNEQEVQIEKQNSVILVDDQGNLSLAAGPSGAVAVKGGLQLNSDGKERPVCDANTRGMFWFLKSSGANGTSDAVEVCIWKNDSYKWAEVSLN